MLDEAISTIRNAFCGSPFEGKLFLVGGLIRDRLLGLPPEQDIDLVCLCDALEAARWLQNAGVADHSPVVYPRFGTAMVSVRGIQVELATARRESYAPHSRKPERVEPATLEEDVLRRDFTVNTLLEDLFTGERLDLTGRALPDLEARIIRTPLDPNETFIDDPLRMLRAVRFAAKLEFQIEEDTWNAIRECAGRLEIISRERIRDELAKTLMLHPRRAARGLDLMMQSGLMAQFAPEIVEMVGVEQNVFHLYDVWTHTLKAIENLPEESSLDERLAMLLHDVGKPRTRTVDEAGGVHFYGHQQVGAEMAGELLHRLKFPNQTVTRVSRLVAQHMRIGEYSDEWSDSAVRRLVRDLGEDMESLFTIAEADRAACNPEHHYLDPAAVRGRIRKVQEEADYARVQSPLDGREIMRIAGLAPGPEVGRLKDYLVNEILEGRLAEGDRKAAERLLRQKLEQEHGRQGD
ncbi:MAG: HD domain-containing protein [Armatimonadota bacterium]